MTAPRLFDPLRERCCACMAPFGEHRARSLACPTGEGRFARKLTAEEQKAFVDAFRAVLGKRPITEGAVREERGRHSHLHHFFRGLPDGNRRVPRLSVGLP